MYRPYTHGKHAFYEEDWSVTYIGHSFMPAVTPIVIPYGTR